MVAIILTDDPSLCICRVEELYEICVGCSFHLDGSGIDEVLSEVKIFIDGCAS